MLALVLVGMATAAPTLKAPDDIFSLDLTWKPALPVGGHTYSGEFSVQEVLSPTHGTHTTHTRPQCHQWVVMCMCAWCGARTHARAWCA
jgi:hypothetical protein